MRPNSIQSQGDLDALARSLYEACHPDDTFDDFKRRTAFSRQDRCLLRAWRTGVERLMRRHAAKNQVTAVPICTAVTDQPAGAVSFVQRPATVGAQAMASVLLRA